MRTLIQDIEINSVKEAEEILKSAGTEDLFEKAHQDGDLHPTRPWIWVSSANKGKGDWRMNKNHKPNTPQELDEKIKKMEEKKEGKSSSTSGANKKRFFNIHPDGTPIDLSKIDDENLKFTINLVKTNIEDIKMKINALKGKKPKTFDALNEKFEDQRGKLSELEEEMKKRK